MYSENDLLYISALQHFVFCRRQCALIHIEQSWVENRFTAEGRVMHENVHELGRENRKDVRNNLWVPFPVEYKRGKPKTNNCDKAQLCAQAICLEEMMNTQIPSGALFYGKTRRRLDVEFTEELRKETEEISQALHEFIKAEKTPIALYEEKCDTCSLKELCLPETSGGNPNTVKNYIFRATEEK
ncbi:MAG: CRISPR-associated protein Cas4 [Elusimicrobiota bacterium]